MLADVNETGIIKAWGRIGEVSVSPENTPVGGKIHRDRSIQREREHDQLMFKLNRF